MMKNSSEIDTLLEPRKQPDEHPVADVRGMTPSQMYYCKVTNTIPKPFSCPPCFSCCCFSHTHFNLSYSFFASIKTGNSASASRHNMKKSS